MIVALLGSLVYCLGALGRAAVPGTVFADMGADLGLSPAGLALLPSAGVAGCMVFIAFCGPIVDRCGAARMLLIGSVLQTAGLAAVGCSHDLSVMMAGEFINGGGRTIVYLAIFRALAAALPPRYFAAALGGFYLFSYGGTFAAGPVFPALAGCTGGWRGAIHALNAATALCALPLLPWALRRRQCDCAIEAAATPRLLSAIRVTLSHRTAVAAVAIALYWSFTTVAASPFARLCGRPWLTEAMNLPVMAGMVGGGTIALACRNARLPFFWWSGAVMAAGFAALALGAPLAGYVCIGLGYGVTGVLLAGVKEFAPAGLAATAVAAVNCFANIGQIAANSLSGALMSRGPNGYRVLFAVFAACALGALAVAVAGSRPRHNLLIRKGKSL